MLHCVRWQIFTSPAAFLLPARRQLQKKAVGFFSHDTDKPEFSCHNQDMRTPSDWLHPDVWTPQKGAACKIVAKAYTAITITPLVSMLSLKHILAVLFSKTYI